MYVILWEFLPTPGREADFERAYGASGDWARFFGRDPGYLGTDLFRDTRDPRRYLTVDRWASREAYDAFVQRESSRYRALDAELAPLCATERRIGSFTG